MNATSDERRTNGIAALVAAAVVLLVGLALINPLPIGVVHDDAMYVILGKSLATGHGLRWLNLPGAPLAVHYPPGFPALLSLVWRAFPEFPANAWAFKALNALLLAVVAAALVVFTGRRLRWPAYIAGLAAVVGCLSIPMLVLSTTVMSETFCLALLVPSLFFAEHVLDRDDASARAILLGATAGALMLVRTNMIAFAGAVVLALLLARRYRSAVLSAATTFIIVLPWELWAHAHNAALPQAMRGDYEPYGAWLASGAAGNTISFVIETVTRTTQEIFGMLAAVTTAGLPTIGLRLLAVLVAIAFLLAGIAGLSRRARATALFIAAYLVMIVLWPFSPTRFIWGIWPLLFVVFVAGVFFVRDRMPRTEGVNVWRLVAIAGAIVVAAGYSMYNFRGYRGRWWSSVGRQVAAVSVPSVNWVAEHTRPSDIIASNAELMVYLYTGRQAVPATQLSVDDFFHLPNVRSRTNVLESILRAYHADVVAIVANDSLEAAARGLASRQPPTLALRDSVPNGLILSSMVR